MSNKKRPAVKPHKEVSSPASKPTKSTFHFRPRNDAQREYIGTINSHELTFGVGPAGTGKSYCGVAAAVQALNNKEVERIVLVRPVVESGERLGFLPGTLQDKVDPYLRPLYDALNEMLSPEYVKSLLEQGVIEAAPLAFMRGRTFSKSFIIMDEAQNTTKEQIKMLLTRMGQGSRMVVTGDLTQIDLPRPGQSGLIEALRILEPFEDIGVVHFNDADVVRHKLVQLIVTAYEADKTPVRTVTEDDI